MKTIILIAFTFVFFTANNCVAGVWNVGASQKYLIPSQVSNLVKDGDTIMIDEGIYANDATKWTKKNLVFFGLGTPINPTILRYSGDIPNGKGIWVFEQPGISDNPYIENITFDGAQVSDGNGGNGAGLRHQSLNLTVNNCKFKNCQNGILEGGNYSGSNVIIVNSEFSNNGYAGTNSSYVGYEHNIYISTNTDSLLVKNCWFHDPRGQANSLKTRAQKSYILYNVIDEAAGYGSWELNIAQGGLVVVVGNLIIQGISGANHGIIGWDAVTNPIEEFYFVSNTVINKFVGNVTFVHFAPSGISLVKFRNNIFASTLGANNSIMNGNLPAQIDTSNNIFAVNYATFGFVNLSENNFNLLAGAISAIDVGILPGLASSGFDLTPRYMVQTPLLLISRSTIGSAIDIGAYEYNPVNFVLENGESIEKPIIFPNPAKNELRIVAQGISAVKILAEIVNLEGQSFVIKEFKTSGGEFSERINLPKEMPAGVYFLRLNSGTQTTFLKFTKD